MQVWVITSGEHDDYKVEAIASTKERAHIISARFNDSNKPFPAEVDQFYEIAKNETPLFEVNLDKEENEVFGVYRFNPGERPGLEARADNNLATIYFKCPNKEAAEKKAEELLKQWKAKGDVALKEYLG